MVNDNKKTKVETAPKKAATPAKESAPKPESTPAAEPAKAEDVKAEGGDTGTASPAGYSRGEGQKPVTQAYKDNWNAIFGKKKKR
jgi:hypothetical protein